MLYRSADLMLFGPWPPNHGGACHADLICGSLLSPEQVGLVLGRAELVGGAYLSLRAGAARHPDADHQPAEFDLLVGWTAVSAPTGGSWTRPAVVPSVALDRVPRVTPTTRLRRHQQAALHLDAERGQLVATVAGVYLWRVEAYENPGLRRDNRADVARCRRRAT